MGWCAEQTHNCGDTKPVTRRSYHVRAHLFIRPAKIRTLIVQKYFTLVPPTTAHSRVPRKADVAAVEEAGRFIFRGSLPALWVLPSLPLGAH